MALRHGDGRDRTSGTGSHRAYAAGHRLDFKVVVSISATAGTTFCGIYEPGETEPLASGFSSTTHDAVIKAMDSALAKRGIVP